MFDSLRRLDKKKVLLHMKLKLEFTRGDKQFKSPSQLNNASESENSEFEINRNKCLAQLDDVNNRITNKLKKEYSYDSVDDLGKKCIDQIIESHLGNLESKANNLIAEQKRKDKIKVKRK